MLEALILIGYALAAAWCVPVALVPLTSRGISPRLGLAAWLTAMGSVLAALVLGTEHAVAAAAADWPQLTAALCRSVAGGVCTPQVYRSALYEAGVTAFAAVVMMLLAAALWRYGRRVQRAVAGTRSHARAALLVGRAITSPIGRAARAVVLDDPRPAAYCVAGRPAAIVLTSGALAVLDQPQLAAVLSHERAHLTARHHALLLLTRGLTAAFPGVPLFTRGAVEIARLAEMAADDAAARANGRQTVIAALLALATVPATSGPSSSGLSASGLSASGLSASALSASGLSASDPAACGLSASGGLPTPRPGLAAAGYVVPARVDRLLRPPRPALAAAFAVTLALTLAALAAAPPLLAALTLR